MGVSIVAVGSVATTTGTTLSVTTPAGAVGDLVVFFLVHDDYSDGILAPISPPITMTTIHNGQPQLGDDSWTGMYCGIETQTAGRAFSFGTLTLSEENKGVCIRFSGHDPTTPIGSGIAAVQQVAGFRFAGGISAIRPGDMFIGVVGSDGTLSSPTPPADWDQRVSSSATNYSLYIATRDCDNLNFYPFPYEIDQTTIGAASASAGDATGYTFVIRKDTSETYTISGVTKDKNGSPLGSCEVALLKEVGGMPPQYRFVACTTSDPSTGAYSFQVYENEARFMVYCIKDDSPHVFDASDNVLQPT